MPEQVTKLKLFVASPGDVKSERKALTQVADELNRTVAAERNLVIEVVRWETHAHPDVGDDPQDVINRQIGPADIFVGILWSRLGTPTRRAESGTVEEFERARDLWNKGHLRHILLYFKTAPPRPQTTDDQNQIQRVCDFRKTVTSSAFVKEFKTVRAFQDLVRIDLSRLILAWGRGPAQAPPSDSIDVHWDRLRTIYMESFDMAVRTEQGWTGINETWSGLVRDDPVWAITLERGILSMENRTVPSAARYVHFDLVDFDTVNAPVSVEVRIDPAPDAHLAGGGLIYRFDRQRKEYLAFIMLAGQRFGLYLRTPEHGYEVLYSGRTPQIKEREFNKLGMAGFGSYIHLYIGDEIIKKVHCRQKLSKEVGIIACGIGRCEFDNFGVYEKDGGG